MTEWKKTGCVCCAQNCGLEVRVEDNRIVKVRPDKENLRSAGYACRKGLKIAHFQHNADRVNYPLKRNGDVFERVSWDQALDEIAAKLKSIVDEHGPRAFAYMGGGGQACHFEAAFGVRLLRGLGSRYHYSALAQELTGMFWAGGRTFGRQYLHTIPDVDNTDALVAVGWNGWMSHQMPQARRHLKRISDDPDKLLIVVDPRRSETAEKADIHLPIRPGTDALLYKSIISILLEKGLQNSDYIEKHVGGFEHVAELVEGFDVKGALDLCNLGYSHVEELCRILAERNWSFHSDLGILMNRHSTLNSYLEIVILAMCGRIGVPGGNVFAGHLMPLGAHSDERDPKTWRTVATDYPAIMGTFPPNVMPEEIECDDPNRLRAVLVSGSNPLRSYADTSAYERAFEKLDLLVTIEVAMSETAALSHYVLPARSGYEKYDASFFAWTYPEIFFQMRPPVVEPEGEQLEESDIIARLADRLGLLPDIPDSLYEAAKGDRMQYGAALMQFAQSEPSAKAVLPFILARTLGPAVGSMSLAALWGMLQTMPNSFREKAARAGFDPGPAMGEQIFTQLMEHPEGIWIGKCDPDENLSEVRTEDAKINLDVPELSGWAKSVTPGSEEQALKTHSRYPFILMAGRHFDFNANTIMRDPAWNDGRDACTMLMLRPDAETLDIHNGETVRVVTEAGSEEVRVKYTDHAPHQHVVIPHGFGLVFQGTKHGANVNRLTKNTHRDPIAATPYHRYVPCRVEKL